jgi:uncharacterized protein DUF3800
LGPVGGQPDERDAKISFVIQSYLDESGVHDNAPVCVIAGYFGEKCDWKHFKRQWLSVFAGAGIPLGEFHAKEWIKNRKYRTLLDNLARTISSNHKIYPVSIGVVVKDFNAYSLEDRKFLTGARVTDGKLVTSGAPSKPYFMPFQQR